VDARLTTCKVKSHVTLLMFTSISIQPEVRSFPMDTHRGPGNTEVSPSRKNCQVTGDILPDRLMTAADRFAEGAARQLSPMPSVINCCFRHQSFNEAAYRNYRETHRYSGRARWPAFVGYVLYPL
jgi:hypothetical protein